MWEVIDKLNKEFDEQYYKAQALEKRVEELEKQLYEKEVLERVRLLQKSEIQVPMVDERVYSPVLADTQEIKNQCMLLNEILQYKETAICCMADFYTCYFDKFE